MKKTGYIFSFLLCLILFSGCTNKKEDYSSIDELSKESKMDLWYIVKTNSDTHKIDKNSTVENILEIKKDKLKYYSTQNNSLKLDFLSNMDKKDILKTAAKQDQNEYDDFKEKERQDFMLSLSEAENIQSSEIFKNFSAESERKDLENQINKLKNEIIILDNRKYKEPGYYSFTDSLSEEENKQVLVLEHEVLSVTKWEMDNNKLLNEGNIELSTVKTKLNLSDSINDEKINNQKYRGFISEDLDYAIITAIN